MNLKEALVRFPGSLDLRNESKGGAGVAPWIQRGQIDPFRASKGSNKSIPIGFSLVFIGFSLIFIGFSLVLIDFH